MVQFKDPRVCNVDLTEKHLCIRHFRDLYNLADLIDFENEIRKFKKQLIDLGWSKELVLDMEILAMRGTRYDAQLPHVLNRY